MPNNIKTDVPDDIQDRVLKVIATTKRLPRESISPESSFEALGIDSLDRLNILFDLESEFDIEINDEDAKRVENIDQMVAGVRELVEAKAEGRVAQVKAISAGPPPDGAAVPASVGTDAVTTIEQPATTTATKLPSSEE